MLAESIDSRNTDREEKSQEDLSEYLGKAFNKFVSSRDTKSMKKMDFRHMGYWDYETQQAWKASCCSPETFYQRWQETKDPSDIKCDPPEENAWRECDRTSPVVDPDPKPEEPDGNNLPVPIYKKWDGIGVKDGGASLQQVLQNWINKNGTEFDRKTLQAAVRQMVMDIGKQFKANKITIQEAQELFSKGLNNLLLEEADPSKKFTVDDIDPLPDESEKSATEKRIKAVKKYLSVQKAGYDEIVQWMEEYEEYEEDALAGADVAFELLKRYRQVKDFPKDPINEASKPRKKRDIINKNIKDKKWNAAVDNWLSGIIQSVTNAWSQLEQANKAVDQERGDVKQGAEQVHKSGRSFVLFYKLGEKILEKYKERDIEPEKKKKKKTKVPTGISDLVLWELKQRLKELDLDTPEGRQAALQDDAAYLGAFMFYKAMAKLLKVLKKKPNLSWHELKKAIKLTGFSQVSKELDGGSPYSPKRTGPVQEAAPSTPEDRAEFTTDIIEWLTDMIEIFKKDGLIKPPKKGAFGDVADSDRGIAAMRAARGAKDPKEQPHVPDPKAAMGQINTKQIVGPRMREAGINLDTQRGNNPQAVKARKLAQNLERVIRRFINRHLKRLGHTDIEKITEVVLKDVMKEILSSQMKFSNKQELSKTLNESVIKNIKKELPILKEIKIQNKSDMDLSEIIEKLESFIPHAQEYMGYPENPNLTFLSDPENGEKILGKTAYYDPAAKEVSIYVDGRHPKDMMRSISHELVHHRQNCDGEFDRNDLDVGEGYAQRDDHLKEMERQAYEEGNMCFREWEDNYKANHPLQERNERLYHKLLRRLT